MWNHHYQLRKVYNNEKYGRLLLKRGLLSSNSFDSMQHITHYSKREQLLSKQSYFLKENHDNLLDKVRHPKLMYFKSKWFINFDQQNNSKCAWTLCPQKMYIATLACTWRCHKTMTASMLDAKEHWNVVIMKVLEIFWSVFSKESWNYFIMGRHCCVRNCHIW